MVESENPTTQSEEKKGVQKKELPAAAATTSTDVDSHASDSDMVVDVLEDWDGWMEDYCDS